MLVSIHSLPVKRKSLAFLGKVLLLGGNPVHCQLFWEIDSKIFLTEMTSVPHGKIVLESSGFFIVSRPANELLGTQMQALDADVEGIVLQYPSRAYGLYTCNSYISWLAAQLMISPLKPAGAIGW